MDDENDCSECGMPPISATRRIINWPVAMIMAAFGAPVFFCKSCGHFRSPFKRNSSAG